MLFPVWIEHRGNVWNGNVLFQTLQYVVIPLLIDVVLYFICLHLIFLAKFTFNGIQAIRSRAGL